MKSPDDRAKHRPRAKPVLLTLVCLALVVAAALLPGAAVRLQDKQLYDTFQPLGQVGGTLALTAEETAALDRLDAYFSDAASYGEADLYPSMEQIAQQYAILLGQLSQMVGPGLLSQDTVDFFTDVQAQGEGDYNIYYNSAETYNGSSLWLSLDSPVSWVWLNGYLYRYPIDAKDYKLIALGLQLPASACPQPGDMRALLLAYMQWLGVATVDDWQLRENQYEGLHEVAATSLNCNLRLSVSYGTYTDPERGGPSASLEFAVSRMIQG